MDQLKTIHAYTERAEVAFRAMLEILLQRVEAGEVEIASHELGPPRREAVKLIERLGHPVADGQKTTLKARSVPELGGWTTARDVDSGTGKGRFLALPRAVKLLRKGVPKRVVFEMVTPRR